jgi:hypothetical protein
MTDNRERTSTVVALQKIESDLRWHNAIGKGMFSIGLIMVGLAFSTLVYFGKLDERVTSALNYATVLDVRIAEGNDKVQGQILRIQARMRDVEKSKHIH